MRPPAVRRSLLVVALATAAVLALPALAGKEVAAPRPTRRFNHAGHASKLAASGKGTEGCAARCHRIEMSGEWSQHGKQEHARCFESCHTFETSCQTLAAGSGKVCVTCHINLKERCVPSGTVRLTGRPAEMPARYSHRRHIMPGAATGKQCEGCHGGFGAGTPRAGAAMAIGHRQCGSCHQRTAQPLLTQCAGCHDGKPAAAATARGANRFAVTHAFDHQRHAAADRVGTSGKDCLVCHANLAQATSDDALPLPTMRGCYQSCHDGKKAFSATGATCTRCHRGGRP